MERWSICQRLPPRRRIQPAVEVIARNQRHESREAHGDEGALGDVFPHRGKIEGLVRSKIGEKVQAHVEKSEEAEHAAKADEIGKLEKLAKWSDAKSEDEKAQRPITGGVLQEFNRIRAELAFDDAPDQSAKRDKTKKKNGDFGPL